MSIVSILHPAPKDPSKPDGQRMDVTQEFVASGASSVDINDLEATISVNDKIYKGTVVLSGTHSGLGRIWAVLFSEIEPTKQATLSIRVNQTETTATFEVKARPSFPDGGSDDSSVKDDVTPAISNIIISYPVAPPPPTPPPTFCPGPFSTYGYVGGGHYATSTSVGTQVVTPTNVNNSFWYAVFQNVQQGSYSIAASDNGGHTDVEPVLVQNTGSCP